MVGNDIFNNISDITVLLVKETGVPGENHRPVASQTLSHNVVSSTPRLTLIPTLNVSGDMH